MSALYNTNVKIRLDDISHVGKTFGKLPVINSDGYVIEVNVSAFGEIQELIRHSMNYMKQYKLDKLCFMIVSGEHDFTLYNREFPCLEFMSSMNIEPNSFAILIADTDAHSEFYYDDEEIHDCCRKIGIRTCKDGESQKIALPINGDGTLEIMFMQAFIYEFAPNTTSYIHAEIQKPE